jgi:death-on-curing protein
VRYVTVGDVLLAHEQEVGPPVYDFGLLEGAVMRPQAPAGGSDAFQGPHAKAAALMHALIRNHPFLDGNKRTAWLAVVLFYGLNGYSTTASDDDVIGATEATARGDADVGELADWLASYTRYELDDEE